MLWRSTNGVWDNPSSGFRVNLVPGAPADPLRVGDVGDRDGFVLAVGELFSLLGPPSAAYITPEQSSLVVKSARDCGKRVLIVEDEVLSATANTKQEDHVGGGSEQNKRPPMRESKVVAPS
jgi:hypothetical protein